MPKNDFKPDCSQCILRFSSFLCKLNREEIEKINRLISFQKYHKGDIIFHENDNIKYIYCINNGKVKTINHDQNGSEIILYLAKDGGILGYRALMKGNIHLYTAIALEETSICKIPYADFLKIISENALFAKEILKYLSEYLFEIKDRYINKNKSAKAKVAEALIYAKSIFGFENDGKTIDVSLKRTEIGGIAGLNEETVTRNLFELEKQKIIELHGKKYKILNLHELIHIANELK